MKSVQLIIFLLLLSSTSLWAQDNSTSEANSGSYYSYFGLGMPISTAGAQEKAMGIIGVSFNDYETSGLSNPAFWGGGAFTRGSAGMSLAQYDAKTTTASSKNNLLDFGTIHVVFPLIKRKIGLSAALYPVTRSNFRSVVANEIYPNAQDTISYISNKAGSGGVSKLEFGFGYSVNKYISIGYAPSLAFIRKSEEEYIGFLNSGYGSSFVTTKVTDAAFSQRFGLIVSKGSVFKRGDILQFGSSVTLPIHFNAKTKAQTTKTLIGTSKTVDLQRNNAAKVSLPLQISSGFTYFASPYLNLSAEGVYEEWSNAEYALDLNQQNSFKDRLMVGFGAQFHPYRKGNEAFFSKFKYSAGISYDEGHLQVANEDISTLWFSTGIGVKAPRASRSSFDISIQYGIRGTEAQNLVKEKVWSIGLSINLTELMFHRQKLN
ncbi:MAG: hypothetical protein WC967_09940 [Balneolaceae bacterium]